MKKIDINKIQTILFDNKTIKQTIFKNTFWLMVGNGIAKCLAFVLLIYVARILGATEYGKFTFALAFVSLFAIFADLAISTILIREFAKEKEKEKEFYSLISLKILLSFGTLLLIIISSLFITADPLIRKTILILALFILVDGFISISYAFFQARQRMEYQAGLIIFGALVLTTCGFFVILNFPSAENLSFAYLSANIVTLIFILIFFHFKILPLKISWDKSIWRRFLSLSWPLAFAVFLATLYNHMDSVMLGYFGKITETGWYNAAHRIAWTSFVFIGLIVGSIFPMISRAFQESKEKFQKIWDYQMELMIVLSFPLMLGGIILAPRMIDFFYGQNFAPSILALQILIVMAGIIILYGPFSQTLVVANLQKKIFWAVLLGAIVNVILNLILIPKYSLYGAAVATVITHLLIFFLFVRLTLKFAPVKISYLRFLTVFIGVILSNVVMFFAISQLKIHVLFLIIIGVIVYSICFLGYRKIISQLKVYENY